MPDYIGGKGCSDIEVDKAENELKVCFASDYKEYLKEIGLACFDGIELTGISDIKRLSVVNVTLEEREYNLNIDKDLYVVHQVGIDGIVIWQNNKGEVYQTVGDGAPQKIYDSLYDYIKEEG